jgi:hypothetical protein
MHRAITIGGNGSGMRIATVDEEQQKVRVFKVGGDVLQFEISVSVIWAVNCTVPRGAVFTGVLI